MLLKEIAIINPKSNVKFNDYINYIDTSAVYDGALAGVDYLDKDFPSRAKRQLQTNDILISSVRPNLKHNYFVKCKEPHLIGSTGFIQVRNNSNRYNSKYLYYFLTSQQRVDLYTSIANFSQTAFPSFNKDVLEDLHIPEISLSKQNHIVNTIGSVDELIESYQSQADKICQTLEQALSVHDDRCLINEYDPFIIKSGIVKFDKEKTYLDTSCVEGINNISSGELITYSKRPSRANMQPIANSVWFAKMKDSNKIIIVTDSDDDLLKNHILSTGFMGIQATQSLPMSLLTAIIISNDFKVQRDLNSVGTTMAGVNNETFLKIQVPKLNETEINDFENKYSPLVSQLSYLRRKIILLKDVKDKLLKKYF